MKKLLSALLASAMLTASIPAMAEGYSNHFENDLYDVIGKMEYADSSEGEIVAEYIGSENDWEIFKESYDYYRFSIYDDGKVVKKFIMSSEENFWPTNESEYYPSYETGIFFPDSDYPAFDEDITADEYIYREYKDYGYAIYKMTANGETAEKELIFREVGPTYEDEYYHIFKVTEKDGEAVEEVYLKENLTEDEFNEIVRPKTYNDGLIEVSSDWETGALGGFADINGEMLYTDGMFSNHDSNIYNLGYVFDVFNNKGVLMGDEGLEDDWYSKIRHTTSVYNMFNNTEYFEFENTKIEEFYDNGYGVLATRNVTDGAPEYYLIKLKKPAIVTVYIDGEKIKFDQIPVIDEGRTLVPLRAIFEAIGAEVDWDGDTKTITATDGENDVELAIDNTEATVNGETVTLDVPAKLVNGRTMVPARFIADSFGVTTDWNGDMKQVILTTK